MSKEKSKAGIGSSLDDFLKEEGIHADVQEVALLRVFAWKIREAMKQKAISKIEMARRMNTSRSQLDRLLDPRNNHVEVATLACAAHAVGYKLSLDLVA